MKFEFDQDQDPSLTVVHYSWWAPILWKWGEEIKQNSKSRIAMPDVICQISYFKIFFVVITMHPVSSPSHPEHYWIPATSHLSFEIKLGHIHGTVKLHVEVQSRLYSTWIRKNCQSLTPALLKLSVIKTNGFSNYYLEYSIWESGILESWCLDLNLDNWKLLILNS